VNIHGPEVTLLLLVAGLANLGYAGLTEHRGLAILYFVSAAVCFVAALA
jgi:hypothetical protein